MVLRAGVLVCGVLLLSGCAWEPELPSVPVTHPANPEAEAGPLWEPSDLLSVSRPPDTAESGPTMRHDESEEGGAGHADHPTGGMP